MLTECTVSLLCSQLVLESHKYGSFVIIQTDFEALLHLASPPDNCVFPGRLITEPRSA